MLMSNIQTVIGMIHAVAVLVHSIFDVNAYSVEHNGLTFVDFQGDFLPWDDADNASICRCCMTWTVLLVRL